VKKTVPQPQKAASPEAEQPTKPKREKAPPPAFDTLPDSALVRAADLVPFKRYPGRAVLLGVSAATLWRWTAEGRFPRPLRIGAGTTCWRVGAIREWLREQGRQADAQAELEA